LNLLLCKASLIIYILCYCPFIKYYPYNISNLYDFTDDLDIDDLDFLFDEFNI